MVVTSQMYLESMEGISRGWFINPELNFFLFLNSVQMLSVTTSLCILFFFSSLCILNCFFHNILLAENARVKKTKY